MLKCVVIDDERHAIDTLRSYIDLFPGLEEVDSYDNPLLAMENIRSAPPVDIVFLDINMPHLCGTDLAKIVRNKVRKIIFTSAHSRYAFDAFDAEGDAYLLKPISFTKFSNTIDRLFPATDQKSPANVDIEFFLVKNKEQNLRIIKVYFNQVVAFESMHNYIKIHLADGKIIVAYLTISDVLELLNNRSDFKQFHRAYIISINFIEYIEGNLIFLTNKLSFSVGERFKNHFADFLTQKLIRTSRHSK